MIAWLRRLFGATPAQYPLWLVRNGHRLHWDQRDRPVNVYLDTSLVSQPAAAWSILFDVCRKLQRNGVPVLLPVAPAPEMLVAFNASRATVFQSILVSPVDHADPTMPLFCSADLRDDDRNGKLRSVIIDWRMTGDVRTDRATIIHELGHAMGLGHKDGTVMQARRLYKGNSPTELSDEQYAALREVYR